IRSRRQRCRWRTRLARRHRAGRRRAGVNAAALVTQRPVRCYLCPMAEILPVNYRGDILPRYRDTPVGLLLEYHNLGRAIGSASAPQLLIGMCMDSRKALRIPNDFAFVLRTAGANMRDNEFRISYAIAVGGVRSIVLIAHTDCGMAQLEPRREQFIEGMVRNAGWDRERAARHFADSAPKFGIRDEVGFVLGEADRLRSIYPKIFVAPLLYRVGRPALPARIGLSVQRRTTRRGALGPGAIEVAPLAPSVAALGAAAKKICDPALGISGT